VERRMERNGMRFISQVASCLSRSSSDPWNRMPVTPVRIVVCRARHSSLVSYPPHSLRTEPKVNGSNWSEMWGWDKRGTPEETWKRLTFPFPFVHHQSHDLINKYFSFYWLNNISLVPFLIYIILLVTFGLQEPTI